jgi:hypothetical protein
MTMSNEHIKSHRNRPTQQFLHDQEGAVTVDWVVLSAVLVVLGAICIGVYRGAVYNLSSSIETRIVEEASKI